MGSHIGVKVRSFRYGKPAEEFETITAACEAYRISRTKLIGLVMEGGELDGSVCFDWDEDADEEAVRQVETNWLRQNGLKVQTRPKARKGRGLAVVAIETRTGFDHRFQTLADACQHYSISRDRLIGYLVSGDQLDGVKFFWSEDCDDEARMACLVAYFQRSMSNSDKHRRAKEAKRASR